MNGPHAGDLVFYMLLLVLPLSALAARRLPFTAMLKMTAAWVAIFGVLLILVGQRERFRPLWDGARNALTGDEQIVQGTTVRIPMAADGHFWASVTINGVARRMLIDSGATSVALTGATARAAGVTIDNFAPNIIVSTANGDIAAKRGIVTSLRLGGITARGLPVVVADAFGDTDVIGMNFLSRLRGWRVEGRTLILEPKHD